MSSLLPPSATSQERALEATTSRLATVPVPVATLWDPQTCPVAILPWLAWALSVDAWNPAWSEAARREAIAQSLSIHQHKGTIGAVRDALLAAIATDVTITEGLPALRFDGTEAYDASETYSGDLRWALFAVAITLGDDETLSTASIDRIRLIIDEAKPARSHLDALTYLLAMMEQVTASEHADLAPVLSPAEFAWSGLRFDGSSHFDQAVQNRFDGSLVYDGAADFRGITVTGARFDNAWETFATLRAGVLENDHPGVSPLCDGKHHFGGEISFGGYQPAVADGLLDLTIWTAGVPSQELLA